MSQMTKARNEGFDVLKGVACVAVVFMHCEFPGVFGILVQCLTRWSVPLFFAVSGYFFTKETIDECFRKARHIESVTVWAVAVYVVIECIVHSVLMDLSTYAASEFTLFNIASFVIFNSPVFIQGHLWFLFALIYVYFSVALLLKLDLFRYKKAICIVLLCCHFILAYGLYLAGREIQGGAYRNFLFEGLPFFIIGNILAKRGEKKQQLYIGIVLIFAGFFLSLIERILLGRDFSVHIGSVSTLIGLILFVKNAKNIAWPKILRIMGEKLSLYIYIIHPAVYMMTESLLKEQELIMQWIRPIYTLTASIIIAMIIYKIQQKRILKNE